MYKYANANSSNYKSQRLRNAQFLHRELPIRIAQRAVDLMTLPHGLNQTPPVRHIVSIYLSYLERFRISPVPTNETEELAFTDMLRPMVLDRSSIPTAVAQGLKSLTSIPHASGSTVSTADTDTMTHHRLQEMEDALYRFFTARIGLRLLTEHHILSCVARRKESEELRIRQSYLENVPLAEDTQGFFWGCIKDNCDPALEARRVAEQVVAHCQKCYGLAPEIQVLDCTSPRFNGLPFTYVPHHLHYMLAELLKNSCRATIRRYDRDSYHPCQTFSFFYEHIFIFL
jgi:pyruvate dehydrogenase kinase 2/3/4